MPKRYVKLQPMKRDAITLLQIDSPMVVFQTDLETAVGGGSGGAGGSGGGGEGGGGGGTEGFTEARLPFSMPMQTGMLQPGIFWKTCTTR
jgi:hypothetical protein